MKKTFWNKRIPSFLGLFFLAISVVIISWFGKSYTQIRSKASVGEIPKQLQISNITETSFTVSYMTDDRITGAINYGSDEKLGQIGLDDRDREHGQPSMRQVHYVTISDLNPDTKYYFSIQSGSTEFFNDKKPYEIVTAKKLPGNLSNQIPITGSVNLPDGTVSVDGIVFLSTLTSQLLSTVIKSDGTYNFSINSLRTLDLTSDVVLERDTILQISIKNALDQSVTIVRLMHANPIPPVTLSKDYNFTINYSPTNPTTPESSATSKTASSSGFPIFPSEITDEPTILTPEEGEMFIDKQPLFRGTTASPNAIVVINFDLEKGLQNNIESDNFGNWQFRPTTALNPGQHTITIQTLDVSGKATTLKRSFTILTEGSQFIEPSVSPALSPTPTASASPTPTTIQTRPTATPTPTSIPTVAFTPAPTLTPTYIPTPTLQQTITPVITTTPTSHPIPSISPPGSSLLFIGGVLTAVSITASFMLFFFL